VTQLLGNQAPRFTQKTIAVKPSKLHERRASCLIDQGTDHQVQAEPTTISQRSNVVSPPGKRPMTAVARGNNGPRPNVANNNSNNLNDVNNNRDVRKSTEIKLMKATSRPKTATTTNPTEDKAAQRVHELRLKFQTCLNKLQHNDTREKVITTTTFHISKYSRH
jgi:hypothetical protein